MSSGAKTSGRSLHERDLVAQAEEQHEAERDRDRHRLELPGLDVAEDCDRAGVGDRLAAGEQQVAEAAVDAQLRAPRRTIVRRVPLVSGTWFGNGGRRRQPGRSQYSGPPIGGLNRNVSGPDPDPIPRNSQRTLKTTTFCQTIGSVHQSLRLARPPSPGVVAPISASPPTAKIEDLDQVDEAERRRRAEPVHGPVLGQRLDLLEVWLRLPRPRRPRRWCGCQESHRSREP